MSYAPNLPNDLQQTIELLSVHQSQIASLGSQPRNTQINHVQLQAELMQYHGDAIFPSSNSIAAATSDITKLPNEILLGIFEHSLSENHRSIRTILTVCGRWHDIVMQSPRLWARVQLSTAPLRYLGLYSSRYIEACLQRSQCLLLDIEIDYVEPQGVNCIGYAMETAIEEIDLLVGSGGKNMRRWHSLDVRFPNWDGYLWAPDIWAKFIGPTPNLAVASFANLEMMAEGLDIMGDGLCDAAFPELSGLRSLTHDDFQAFFPQFKIPSSRLHHLDIRYSLNGIRGLSNFPLLRKLSLTFSGGTPLENPRMQREFPLFPLFVVHLPLLEELILVGSPNILRDVQFDFPCLHTLLLVTSNGFHLHSSLSPAHICWSVMTPFDAYWTERTVTSILMTLLQSSNRVQVVTIPELARLYVPQVLSDLQQSPSFPALLKRVVVELVDGGREIVDVSSP